jgi:parallel beta helix pectate lyase-like protein
MPASSLPRRVTVAVAVAVWVLTALPATALAGVGVAVPCGTRVTSDFTLGADLLDCPGDGLVVAAGHITVDLGGHTVEGRNGQATAGVRVAGFNGVTVTGGFIRRFGKGILLSGSSDDHVTNNVVTDSFDEGIFTDAASARTQIEGDYVSGSGVGSGATWADGIDARGDGLLVRANTIVNNHDDGIDVGGAGVTVDGNRVDGSGQDGIDVDGHASTVQGNTSTRNGDDGIGVGRNASDVTLRGNVTADNADMGIQPIAGTAVDGGGNQASGNGDPRQCTLVRCTAVTSPPPAPPPPPAPTHAPTPTPRPATRVTARAAGHLVTGTVTSATGQRLRGGHLTLQRRRPGTSSWTGVARETANAHGVVRVTVHPRRTSFFRWVFKGTAAHAPARSRAVRVRP